MNIDYLQILISLMLVVITAVITFLTTKHNLKEYTNSKFDELKKEIHIHDIEMEKLRSRDENQQQIIDAFKNQVLDHLPSLFKLIDNNKTKK